MTDFIGAAKRLDDIDLPRIGSRIGVGEDEIHAFMEVEAAGSGFDSKNRPKMLFEPHIFYKYLGDTPERATAVKQGLAYPKWKKGYPKDSYPRLEKAMLISKDAALKSASWGLGQILGENHKAAGYNTVNAMVTAFMADEENHLEAMVQFLITNHLDDDLRDHNWVTLARGYNGPQYAKNGYDTKLATAFAKWSKIKDTPYLDQGTRPVVREYTEEEIANVQEQLFNKGFKEVGSKRPDGTFDGKLGRLTRSAILAFRDENGLPLGSEIDDEFILALAKSGQRKLTRNDTPADKIREVVPEVKTNWLTKIGALILGIPTMGAGLVTGVASNISLAQGYIEPLKAFVGDVPGYYWLILVGVISGGLYLVSQYGETKGKEAFREGARR